MKEKNSITRPKLSRSACTDAVPPCKQSRARMEAHNMELINKAADELNAEVEDILRYQDSDG